MKIIISGGGSGGHVYPAIAIANGIKAVRPKAEILFVGAKGKLEMEKVPKAGFPVEALNIRGFDRQRKFRNITLPFNLLSSLVKAGKILRRFQPDVAIGVGGYASGPLLHAAARRKIPTLLQEQNSYPGVTNKLLSKRAHTICVAYDGMNRFFDERKIVLTGNPVRTDIANLKDRKAEALKYFGLNAEQPILFAFGGSLGAKTINESFLQQTDLLKKMNAQLLWQTGKFYHEQIKNSEAAQLPNVHIHPFIDRMDLAYAAADVVIGRAGALTISELCMVGKAAILIPSPNVAEDHQTKNAKSLADKNAAILIRDKEARQQLLVTALDLLVNEERRKQLGANIKQLAQPEATKKIVAEALRLIA
ncbi:MAG: undecaprenyldiphospho-muramoylpentapeptide beta-N-acetylglucosaminyltransferase [Bacteroidota bacterium]